MPSRASGPSSGTAEGVTMSLSSVVPRSAPRAAVITMLERERSEREVQADPFLLVGVEASVAFGHERIMWASDMGGNQTGESWAELLFYIRDAPTLTREEKDWILGKTVRSLLGWH